MDDTAFVVMRLKNEPGKFLVTPGRSVDAPIAEPLAQPQGLIPPAQEFRGTEEETRAFLAGKGQLGDTIDALIEQAYASPEFNAPEYIVTYTLSQKG